MKTFNILLCKSILFIFITFIFTDCKEDTNPLNEIPVFGTSSVSSIGNVTASIDVDFGYKLYPYSFKFGVKYDVSPSFTASSTVSCNNPGTANIVNLNPSTTYYYKAYATNGIDYVYGDVLSFTTTKTTAIVQTDSGSSTGYFYDSYYSGYRYHFTLYASIAGINNASEFGVMVSSSSTFTSYNNSTYSLASIIEGTSYPMYWSTTTSGIRYYKAYAKLKNGSYIYGDILYVNVVY